MAAIQPMSGVAWKTAQRFPLGEPSRHSWIRLRRYPPYASQPPPLPPGEGWGEG